MKSGSLADPVLVGREHELEELQHSLDLAIKGKGTTVFVSGEAGAGKTRLTQEFLKSAKRMGVSVAAGWCLSNSAIPYFPFLEAFSGYFTTDYEEEYIDLQQSGVRIGPFNPTQVGNEAQGITALLSGTQQLEKLGKLQTLNPQTWKDQTYAAVAKKLHWMSAQEPLILLLEDIHWADSASLALLYYVARAIKSERILVLATFRSEELTADAEGHPHPLAETMRLMRREELFAEVRLSNLDQTSISKMTSDMVGGTPSPELVGKLSSESRGNALFVVESLRMLFERKSLVEESGEWHLAADKLGIPSKIKDIILRRLAILKFNQRRVLDAASVIGEKFDTELLSAVLGQDSLEVLETISQIAQSTSLVCVEENYYRFDHAKSKEALYEEIPTPLKRGYHARIAERMEKASKSDRLPLADLAYHYAQAGNEEKAVKYSLAAGQDSLAKWSNNEAIKQFTFVLQTVGEGSKNYGERVSALEGLGDAYYANSMYKQATKTFELLSSIGTGVVKLRAFRKAMDSAFFQVDISHLVELVEKAEEHSALDRLENARVQVNRSRANLFLKRKTPDSIGVIESRIRVFEEEYSLWDTALGMLEMGNVAATMGKWEKGLAAYLRSIALFDELGDLRWQARVRLRLASAYSPIIEAFDLFAKAVELFEKIGDFGMLAEAHASLAVLFERRGSLEEAVSRSLKALEYSNKTDSTWARSIAYSSLARQYAKLGDQLHAEEYFQKLMNLPHDQHAPLIRTNLSLAVFFASKNLWSESDKYFKKLEAGRTQLDPWVMQNYAWALERQGKTEAAKAKREEAKKTTEGLKQKFAHINIEASLMAPRRVVAREEFEMRLDLVNISRKSGLLIRVESLVPAKFSAIALPTYCRLEKGSVDVEKRSLNAFQVETLKFSLKASETGTFSLQPQVTYLDEKGETKTCKTNPLMVTVQPAQPKYEVLPRRVPTGFEELDALLFGGIPEKYAIVLTSPPTDERELLIKRFLEAGAEAGETGFHITAEVSSMELTAEFKSNFYIFICNPRADAMVQDLPNVFRLKGVENLTEIDIAFTKAFRRLQTSVTGPKRACVEILNDVLLQHHAVTTRKWLSTLLQDLKTRGFSTLAVIDPQMHPHEELQSIVGVFDGEIRVTEKETPEGIRQTLKVRKLLNQKYLEKEIVLTKERIG